LASLLFMMLGVMYVVSVIKVVQRESVKKFVADFYASKNILFKNND